MSIQAIIVNYNAGETLAHCVQALLNGTQKTNITVIDNASSDRSAENLQNLRAIATFYRPKMLCQTLTFVCTFRLVSTVFAGQGVEKNGTYRFSPPQKNSPSLQVGAFE